jgi:RNA polymerase sigma factor (sigma-70 family)
MEGDWPGAYRLLDQSSATDTNGSASAGEPQASSSATASESWRAWVRTGTPPAPVDRRRVRGGHRGLKKMLIDGLNGGKDPQPWKDFSSAMVRQAVGEAMSALPSEHRQVVKLAYFGGLTNREIAAQLGLTLSGVRRRLRQALATVSEYVEHGREFGRRAAYAFVLWLAGRSLARSGHRPSEPLGEHLVRAAAVVAAGATAAAVIASHPASPAQLTQVDRGGGASPAATAQPSLVHEVEVPATTAALPTPSSVGDLSSTVSVVTSAAPWLPVQVPAPPQIVVPPIPTPPPPPLPKLTP